MPNPEAQLRFGNAWAWCGFDTETSGLPIAELPWDHPDQPRVAAIALIRCTPTFVMQRRQLLYVKPDGWKMQEEASKVNGISNAFLEEHGVPITQLLDAYEEVIREGRALIGHNVAFDLRMMRHELRRAGRDDRFSTTPHVCTMQKAFGVVKAKNADGSRKPPSLEDCMRHLKIPQHGQHTACGDAISTILVAQRLSEFGLDMSPKTLKRRPANEKQTAA